ncbi:YdiY family protein [Qipengyuania sp. MTN3-11]|uniref:DUF481 domain-containing protein n=1 Tax=Qipengyuania sp. MTN3-11 TaxID=3056557 RepID=UPI0036F28B52
MPKFVRAFLFLPFLATPAAAELPEPVRAMLEAARASGDAAVFDAVAATARQTNPDDAAEIDALVGEVHAARQAAAAKAAEAERLAIEEAGPLDRWSGKGEIGAFTASGNSSSTGLTAAVELMRAGNEWTHSLRARADYQRDNGRTSREQFFGAYEPRYQIGENLFAYGLAQYERDRFQGYSGRYALSGGLGVTVFDGPALDLSAKAGPAYRHTRFIAGGTEDSLNALVGLDFDWRFAEGLALTQDANLVAAAGGEAVAIIGGRSTSVTLVTGLDAKVTDRLTTRLAFTLDYDSKPPAGAVETDTLTRFTLVYGF